MTCEKVCVSAVLCVEKHAVKLFIALEDSQSKYCFINNKNVDRIME